MGEAMGFLTATQEIIPVSGERGSVLVCELENQDVLEGALGVLPPHQELLYLAILKAVPPDPLNTTPIEVWVTGVRIGYVDESQSPRYWRQLREMSALASCGCLVRTDGSANVIWVRLSLPETM
jgi:hypothetical protein